MKILIATGLYPPDIGGPATYTKMLEEHLPKQQYTLIIVPFGSVRHYPKIIRHLVYLWKVLRAGRGCTLYYALDPVSVGVPVYFAHLLTGKPYLMRIAGDYAWEQGQQRFGITETLDEFLTHSSHSILVRMLQAIQTFVAKRAAAVIVPSKYMRGVVSTWGVSSDRIKRIYSALHPLVVHESRDLLRKQCEYTGIVITTAGRLVPWKGMGLLIEILPELRKRLGEVTLVIIGDGPLETELKERAVRFGMSAYVRFLGRMPKDTLGAAIVASDVFVLNTSYEGMSHQLIEVMDIGVPVVATSVGGNPELVEDGVSGCLVPYNDAEVLTAAIVKVVSDGTFREGLIKRARERTRAFARETVVAELGMFLKSFST